VFFLSGGLLRGGWLLLGLLCFNWGWLSFFLLLLDSSHRLWLSFDNRFSCLDRLWLGNGLLHNFRFFRFLFLDRLRLDYNGFRLCLSLRNWRILLALDLLRSIENSLGDFHALLLSSGLIVVS
jgi:hypothetical protein